MSTQTAERIKAPTPADRGPPRTLLQLGAAFLRKPSPVVLTLTVVTAWILRIVLGGWGWGDLIVAVGVVSLWPLQEWAIHVFLLHSRPVRIGPFTLDSAQARKHRAHHRQPWKLDDLFVPLHTYGYALPILILVGVVGLPTQEVALTGIAVYVSLGMHYEWCHLMAHCAYVPRTRFYNRLWRHHRLHHFKNEALWLGVSSTLGDRILGTCPDHRSVEKSPTCRTLGISEESL